MQRLPLAALLGAAETIIPAYDANIPAAVVYTNAAELGMRRFLDTMLQGRYRPYHARFEPVMIGRLPADALLLGGHSYWLVAGGALMIDQINPLTPDIDANLLALGELPFETEHVDEPCLLLSRYGDVTWGHWVAEILPRAIMAEQAFPRRFRYLIGAQISTGGGQYAKRVLESLAAYGIGADRLLPVRLDRHYRFSDLHAVTGIWSAAGMNQQVMKVMRAAAAAAHGPSPRRLAVLRRDAATRNVANYDDVERRLAARDFMIVDPGARSFAEQVALFREATQIFGVLGSGLIGLIYAPDGVKLASLAPGAWADTYFHGLVQLRHGWHADIRCPVLWTGEGIERDAPVLAPLRHIEAGFEALATAPRARMDIGGCRLRREIGETVFSADFGAGSLSGAELGKGWSAAEAHHRWSEGTSSTIRIPLPGRAGRMELELDVLALTDPDVLPVRQLDIWAGGVKLGGFLISGLATISCPLPPDAAGAAYLDLRFDTPFCVPARATGHAPDDRPLGIGFLKLRLVGDTV